MAAGVSSLADETPEGRSIVDFVTNHYGLADQTLASAWGAISSPSAPTPA